jgi:hypothetical protein
MSDSTTPKPETGDGTGDGQKSPKDPFIIRSFPANLGSSDLPYVTIKIFETKTGIQTSSDEFSSTFRAGTQRLYAGVNAVTTSSTLQGAALGGVLGGSIGSAALGGLAGAFSGTIAESANTLFNNLFETQGIDYVSQAKNQIKNFSLKRNESQLSGMIALFMPEGMTASYDQEYDGISITQALGAVGFVAQAAGSSKTSKTGSVNGTNPYLAEGAMMALSKLAGGNEQLSKIGIFAQTGTVVNPQIELLYTSPVLRKFTLDFRLVPRNKSEAAILFGSIDRGKAGNSSAGKTYLPDMGIITMLKYFSAPKIVENVGGRYFVPPAQFQLEFYRQDPDDGGHKVNQNLFKTKNCVLESVNLDYGPNGFATYRDGVPVEVRMQLTFQETVMLDRGAILEGY